MKDERVNVAIPKTLHRRLLAEVKRTRLSLRVTIEDAIKSYLSSRKEGNK